MSSARRLGVGVRGAEGRNRSSTSWKFQKFVDGGKTNDAMKKCDILWKDHRR